MCTLNSRLSDNIDSNIADTWGKKTKINNTLAHTLSRAQSRYDSEHYLHLTQTKAGLASALNRALLTLEGGKN